ncbi:MAG: calcium-binding protein [Pyrinomonadaceae bacterium]|nr:calcium-binding protein [Pyrinomonadaceae bacterium]
MAQVKHDKVREERITMEIIVDAYDEIERALGWYYYLEEKLEFPFKAKCIASRQTSPLTKGETVKVVGMPPEKECEREMFVNVRWQKRTIAVPLSQLAAHKVDEETQEAIEDWHYWVNQGRQF